MSYSTNTIVGVAALGATAIILDKAYQAGSLYQVLANGLQPIGKLAGHVISHGRSFANANPYLVSTITFIAIEKMVPDDYIGSKLMLKACALKPAAMATASIMYAHPLLATALAIATMSAIWMYRDNILDNIVEGVHKMIFR